MRTMRNPAKRLDTVDAIVYGIGMNATASPEIWTTTVVEVETPRGTRYQGVCYVGEGRVRFGRPPRNAHLRYATRLHKSSVEAGEQARSRTIHHNLWHDGSEDAERIAYLHHRGDCHEREAQVIDWPALIVAAADKGRDYGRFAA